MRLLIIGSRGQFGQALHQAYSAQSDSTILTWARPTYDITQPSIIDQLCESQPDVVINAAAWTDVDGAESYVEQAYAVNMLGPKYLAEGCARCGAKLVHISTNEVFAGEPGHFYREYDQPNPGSIYARSKLAGERAAQATLDKLWIVRVSWLYGIGENNFPAKICAAADKLTTNKLTTNKHSALRVVDDEFGNPTHALDAAQAIQQLIQQNVSTGIYHLINSGYASRYEFAQAVLEKSGRGHIPITPIPASQWPRQTQPPAHAVLVNQAAAAYNITLRPWQEALSSGW